MSAVTAILNKEQSVAGRRPIQLVPYAEWFSALETRSTDESVVHIKAFVLLDFLRAGIRSDVSAAPREAMGLAMLQTSKTRAVSNALDKVGILNDSDTVKWIEYWGVHALFNL